MKNDCHTIAKKEKLDMASTLSGESYFRKRRKAFETLVLRGIDLI